MAIAPPRGTPLDQLRFTNSFAALGDAFSERRTPTGIPGARLVSFSPEAAALIDLRPGEESRLGVAGLVRGDRLLPGVALREGMEPVAAMYGGHQFGVWAGQLGDGRAILFGEVDAWELQIKGG